LPSSDSNANSALYLNVINHGTTNTGHIRTKKEDSILLLPEESIWVVANGMGGHYAGDLASQPITLNMSSLNKTTITQNVNRFK
jgi:serine/threonine protein phosphatase PrpC